MQRRLMQGRIVSSPAMRTAGGIEAAEQAEHGRGSDSDLDSGCHIKAEDDRCTGARALQSFDTGLPQEWSSALAILMPFFLFLDKRGLIQGCGPSIAKLLGAPLSGAGKEAGTLSAPLIGADFHSHFHIERPQGLSVCDAMCLPAGSALHVRLIGARGGMMRASMAPLVLRQQQGWLLNMSCGGAAPRLLKRRTLEEGDFPATDMALDLRQLQDDKMAAMAAGLRLQRRLRGARSEAERMANTDSLTGLRNRRVLDETLRQLCDGEQGFVVIHMDLDRFKQINDRLGHAAGDHALQVAAGILLRELRSKDVIIRRGGDEFVLILSDVDGHDEVSRIAARLVNALKTTIEWEGGKVDMSASLGIACSTDYQIPQPSRILSDADMALYDSKRAGRACYRFFTPTT